MIQRSQNIDNLLRLASLKEAVRDTDTVRQHIKTAEDLQTDLAKVTSPASKFLMAYEAIHSLAMATLNHFSVRAGDGEGHRTVALALVLQETGLDKTVSGSAKTLSDLHRMRNEKTYRQPIPPISKANADAAEKLLALILPEVSKLVAKT